MGRVEERICDAPGLEALIAGLSRRIATVRHGDAPLRLVGVRTRGVPIAQRLANRLRQDFGDEIPVGAVDITLYRDDLHDTQHWPVIHGTDIPFEVEGSEIVVVDDVLYTGRTVRAAISAVCDLGRPACVRLAVVVDRGGRELPIQADFVGLAVATTPGQVVKVRVQPVDAVDEIVRYDRQLGTGPGEPQS